MKLKYLYESANTLLAKLNEAEVLRPEVVAKQWRFTANPECCEKCKKTDGYVVKSPQVPTWYGHVPGEPGRYNCRCEWEELV